MILYMNKKDCNILKIKIRFELEKYLKRDKSILEDEKKYIEELKKIDVLIKK